VEPPVIRPARAGDLAALIRIEHSVFEGDRLSRDSLRRFIKAPSVALLVGERAGGVSGYALTGFRRGSKRARLYSIAADPGVALRGMGSALLAASEEAARVRGCECLCLEVRIDNARAIALYRRKGFVQTGREADYYEDGAEALRFEKRLF
jgi:ribosomal protein S18 acetylase RimI-like enzyme